MDLENQFDIHYVICNRVSIRDTQIKFVLRLAWILFLMI